MFFSGLRPYTWYDTPLNKKQAYVFVANHFSYLDILSLNVQLGHYFRFMAKSELGSIPLFKIFFRTIDIAVDRKSVRNSIKAYQYAERALKEGDSLGIFPEGGIGKQVPKLSSFKSGAFKMAVETNTPIVPVTIVDNWRRLPGGGLDTGGTPGPMRMIVHAPIDTTTLQQHHVPDLMDKVYHIIQNNFDKRNFADAYENYRF